jgi:plastocyanin
MKQRLPLVIGLVALVAIVVVAVVLVNGKKFDKDISSSANPTTHSEASMNDTIETDKVSIKDLMFMPVTIKVKAGTTVTWTNDDSTAHTVTLAGNPDLAFTSGSLAAGESYTMTFKKAGTYNYTCDFHSSMHGTVVVTD